MNISPQRPIFKPRPDHVKFVLRRVAMGQVVFVCQYFMFPLSVSFHQCLILIWSPVSDAQKMELWNTDHLKMKLLVTRANTIFLVRTPWPCTFRCACTTNWWTGTQYISFSHLHLTCKYVRWCPDYWLAAGTGLNKRPARTNSTAHLTFRHRASCILEQVFRYSPENAFYIFNQQIYFIIWYLLDGASLI